MKKANAQFFKLFAIGAAFVFITLTCRALSLRMENPLWNKFFVYTRDFLFIGLFSFWGLSIRKRILHSQVRRMLLAVAVLLLFWFFVREMKFRFIISEDINRYLWYLYYIPLLFVPVLGLSVSMSLGKSEDYRLPKWMLSVYAVTVVLVLLVLTNDLHENAFVFTDPLQRDEWHYAYGWLYYAVTVWIYLCAFSAFFVMSTKLRVPQSKKVLWMPLVPIGVALLYGILYAIQNRFIHAVFNDLSAVFSLVFIAFFESCIRCNLIPSNSRYADLFYASEGISAQITDKDYRVCYRARDAQSIDPQSMRLAEDAPVILEGKKRLCNNSINGGHAIWTEDIAKLLELRETLQMRGEELGERNAFLQLEYQKEEAHKRTEEQNRLYDLLQNKTQRQLDRIEELITAYQTAKSEEEKQHLLANIIVLGAFIKRRKNFVLTADENELIPQMLLSNALAESFRALELCGVRGGFVVDCGEELQQGHKLILAYDFFEYIMEAVLEEVHFIHVFVTRVGGVLRVKVATDCSISVPALHERFAPVTALQDDDGTEYLFPLEGGEAP